MNIRKLLIWLFVLVGWFALIAQLVLHLQNSPADLMESLTRFFSFFTILTNALVIVGLTVLLLKRPRSVYSFFSKPRVQTAIVLYITAVGLVYNVILRSLWITEGLQYLLHDILHTVIPIGCLVLWWLKSDTSRLEWRMIPAWLLYPVIYVLFVLFRGQFSNWYPYPFFDVGRIGLQAAVLNGIFLVATFLIFSFIFVFIGKKKCP